MIKNIFYIYFSYSSRFSINCVNKVPYNGTYNCVHITYTDYCTVYNISKSHPGWLRYINKMTSLPSKSGSRLFTKVLCGTLQYPNGIISKSIASKTLPLYCFSVQAFSVERMREKKMRTRHINCPWATASICKVCWKKENADSGERTWPVDHVQPFRHYSEIGFPCFTLNILTRSRLSLIYIAQRNEKTVHRNC